MQKGLPHSSLIDLRPGNSRSGPRNSGLIGKIPSNLSPDPTRKFQKGPIPPPPPSWSSASATGSTTAFDVAKLGALLSNFDTHLRLDLAIDSADEVDPVATVAVSDGKTTIFPTMALMYPCLTSDHRHHPSSLAMTHDSSFKHRELLTHSSSAKMAIRHLLRRRRGCRAFSPYRPRRWSRSSQRVRSPHNPAGESGYPIKYPIEY